MIKNVQHHCPNLNLDDRMNVLVEKLFIFYQFLCVRRFDDSHSIFLFLVSIYLSKSRYSRTMWLGAALRACRTPAPKLALESGNQGKRMAVVPANVLWRVSPSWSWQDRVLIYKDYSAVSHSWSSHGRFDPFFYATKASIIFLNICITVLLASDLLMNGDGQKMIIPLFHSNSP